VVRLIRAAQACGLPIHRVEMSGGYIAIIATGADGRESEGKQLDHELAEWRTQNGEA